MTSTLKVTLLQILVNGQMYSKIVRAILKPVNSSKNQRLTISKADNNNNYIFDQALGKK